MAVRSRESTREQSCQVARAGRHDRDRARRVAHVHRRPDGGHGPGHPRAGAGGARGEGPDGGPAAPEGRAALRGRPHPHRQGRRGRGGARGRQPRPGRRAVRPRDRQAGRRRGQSADHVPLQPGRRPGARLGRPPGRRQGRHRRGALLGARRRPPSPPSGRPTSPSPTAVSTRSPAWSRPGTPIPPSPESSCAGGTGTRGSRSPRSPTSARSSRSATSGSCSRRTGSRSKAPSSSRTTSTDVASGVHDQLPLRREDDGNLVVLGPGSSPSRPDAPTEGQATHRRRRDREMRRTGRDRIPDRLAASPARQGIPPRRRDGARRRARRGRPVDAHERGPSRRLVRERLLRPGEGLRVPRAPRHLLRHADLGSVRARQRRDEPARSRRGPQREHDGVHGHHRVGLLPLARLGDRDPLRSRHGPADRRVPAEDPRPPGHPGRGPGGPPAVRRGLRRQPDGDRVPELRRLGARRRRRLPLGRRVRPDRGHQRATISIPGTSSR